MPIMVTLKPVKADGYYVSVRPPNGHIVFVKLCGSIKVNSVQDAHIIKKGREGIRIINNK